MDRQAVIQAILARALQAGRKVYGFSSAKASCAEVRGGKVLPEFDRLCVEGDTEWLVIASSPAPSGDKKTR